MKQRPTTLALLLICATGCYRYEFNDGHYLTANGLYEAQAEYHARLLGTVDPLPSPLVPVCHVFMPKRQVLEQNAVFQSDAAQRDVEVIAETVRRQLLFNVRVMQKRRLCGTMTLAESEGGHVHPNSSGTFIYAYNAEEGMLEWFAVEQRNEPRMLPSDHRILDAEQAIQDWLSRVESRLVPSAPRSQNSSPLPTSTPNPSAAAAPNRYP